MKKIIAILASLILITACTKQQTKNSTVDFEESMGKEGSDWHHIVQHRGNKERIDMLKEVYDKAIAVPATSEEGSKIPKVIHYIWLGPKSPPHYFWRYKESWEKMHPDWQVRFWRDSDAEELDFELKPLFASSTNYGEKADVLRAEILDRFGGLYVDVDIECKKSFDCLVEKYDFFAGIEPPHQGDFTQPAPHIVISNALIGATPNHPIIKEWKQRMKAGWDELEKKYPDSAKRVLLRSFYPFGDAVLSKINDGDKVNIVLPPTYFYPLTFSEVSKGRLKKNSFLKRQIRTVLSCFRDDKTPFVDIRPETMAVHYWGNSWIKSYEERLREMYRHMMAGQVQIQEKIMQLEENIEALRTAIKTVNEEKAA